MHLIRINSNWFRPHGIRIEGIRIKTGLLQSTYRGGLKPDRKVNRVVLRDNSVIITVHVKC